MYKTKNYMCWERLKKEILIADGTHATVSKKASIEFTVEENKNTKYKLKANVLERCIYGLILETEYINKTDVKLNTKTGEIKLNERIIRGKYKDPLEWLDKFLIEQALVTKKEI